ncbi:hypothetical protein [Streptomyces osmaniensis]|uniref:Secreted protein n=1 Tax=Streptomyces osmaniensis TaxID=593134 RepID=A0ABP6Z5D6_9ACTN|nr:hypothetical protein KJK32_44705 [Streptomyces sp. JCM17656]
MLGGFCPSSGILWHRKEVHTVRLARTFAATAAAVLAFGVGGTAAHASDDTESTGSASCFIHIEGDGNNAACRDALVGSNNTAGTGHSIGLTSPQPLQHEYTVNNRDLDTELTYNCSQNCSPSSGSIPAQGSQTINQPLNTSGMIQFQFQGEEPFTVTLAAGTATCSTPGSPCTVTGNNTINIGA